MINTTRTMTDASRRIRELTLLAMLALSGCASLRGGEAVSTAGAHTNPVACADKLVGNNSATGVELNSRDIRLVNWNIRKGGDPQWTRDLDTIHSDPDLVVLQEAADNLSIEGLMAAGQHASFSPGYRTGRALTGVMTVSAAQPLTQCNFVSVEPWLRSPKATLITEYGLTGTDQTLLVVNIHSINFTIGTRAFKAQIGRAASVLGDHDGPILMSGDFNTWRPLRSRVLKEMAESLNLATLDFQEDHRKRVLGQPLDHIYVRGLRVIEATTHRVTSSDHNPMTVQLSL